jgi:hypothetical protein
MLKRLALIFVAVALLAAMVGCSKPPEAEMAHANSSMAAAQAAEAETYVPDSFRAANDSLNAANALKTEQDSKFALFRSYGKSKDLFVKSAEMFDNVATEAAAEKERVHQQVVQMLTDAKALIDSANAALAKAPRGKGSKADIELIKNDLATVMTQVTDAEGSINTGKYMVAKGQIESLVAKTRSIMDEIAAAVAKKAGK